MPVLSITEASKMFGKSRTTLYKYNKDGKLSFVSGDDGKPAVDMSEMLRVFGNVQKDWTHESDNERLRTSISTAEHLALEEKIAALKEMLRRQDDLLQKADAREKWLQERLERSQQQMQALIHQPLAETAQKRKWWRLW